MKTLAYLILWAPTALLVALAAALLALYLFTLYLEFGLVGGLAFAAASVGGGLLMFSWDDLNKWARKKVG